MTLQENEKLMAGGRPTSRGRNARRDSVMREVFSNPGLGFKISKALGLTHQNVAQWKRVPAHWVLDVAAIIDKTPEQIRPDIFGKKRKPKGR